jgi:subtilisin-like proprotein convertase family protein
VVTIGGSPTAPNGSTFNWSETGNNNGAAITGSSTVSNPTVTIDPSATGSVEYTVQADLSGCTGSDAVTITIDPIPTTPTAVASPSSVCAGVTSTLTASSGAGSGTYTWLDAPGGATIGSGDNLAVTPTVTTTYYVISTDPVTGCISLEGSVTVTVAPAPVANAGTDLIGCEGNSLNLNGSIANPDGGCSPAQTWTVISGSGSFDDPNSLTAVFTPTSTGLIQLELTPCTSGSCAAVSDIVDLNVTVSPSVAASSQDTELCLGLITTLDATASGGTPTPPTIITEGPFTSTGGPFAVPNNDCSTGVSSTITVSGVSSSTVGSTTITVCINTDLNGNDDVSLVLCGPGGSPCLTLTPAPNNGLTGNNFIGTCFSSDGATLTGGGPYTGDWLPLGGNMSDLDGASTNGTWTLTVYDCAGGPSGELDDWSVSFDTPVANEPYTYDWSPIGQLDDPTISTPTFFSSGLTAGTNYCLDVTVTDDNNCTAQDQVCIDIIDVPTGVSAGSNVIQCPTDYTLSGSALGVGETGLWTVVSGTGSFDDDTSPTATISGLSLGDNILEWSVTNSCGSTTAQVTITVLTPPTATISADNGPICDGVNAVWTISGTNGADVTYNINGGGNNIVTLTGGNEDVTVIGATSDQTLNITLVDDNGCTLVLTESVTIVVNTTPTPDAPGPVTACDSYTLPALVVGDYYTATGGPSGGGTLLNAGEAITSTQTIYVYAETGTVPNCFAENSFLVTINTTPTPDAPGPVTACDSYILECRRGDYLDTNDLCICRDRNCA